MSDNDDSGEPDPIVTKSITVCELMDGTGERWLSIETEGEPTPWDCMGMLADAFESYRTERQAEWAGGDE